MDIQDKTKEELIIELQELLQENNSLKALKRKRGSRVLLCQQRTSLSE